MLGSALGLFVSAFARTEFQAVQFMPALVIPQILLCGLFVPARASLPDVLERDQRRAPAVLRRRRDAAPHHGRRTGEVWADLAVVAAYAVAGLALGAGTLRRRSA